MRLPFKVTLRSSFDGSLFRETVCADDAQHARRELHSLYNADIVSVTPVPLRKFRVVETDVACGVQSIVYTSCNTIEAEAMCAQLTRAWIGGEKYTFRVEEV